MSKTLKEVSDRITAERRRDLGANTDNLFCHMVTGLCEEAGEVAGLLKRKFKGIEISPINWQDELGDVLWYLVNIVDVLGLNMDDVAEYNRLKLEGRYKNES